MFPRVNIGCHDVVVGPVQQYLAQKLDGLALGDVRLGLDEDAVVLAEKKLEVNGKIARHKFLVLGKEITERAKGVCSHFK